MAGEAAAAAEKAAEFEGGWKQIKHVEGIIEVHCGWKWNLYGNLVLNVENDVNVMVYLLLIGCMFDGIKSQMLGPCGYLVACVAYLQQLPQNP